MGDLAKRQKWMLWAALIAAGFVATYLILTELLVQREASQTNNRAEVFADAISGALTRLDHLPFVVAQDPGVARALETGEADTLNAVLSDFATRAGAEAIFVLDADGLTIAASNHDQPLTFLGQSYRFRPYFTDAIAGQTGHFFAIGATTGRPGYFVSEPVHINGQIAGVVTVKIGLEELSQAWGDTGERILVTNAAGVVILASEPQHLFGTLRALSSTERADIAAGQQFSDRPLDRLDWTTTDNIARLDGAAYLLSTAPVAQEGWTVHVLTSLAPLQQQSILAALTALVLGLGIILTITSFRSARLDQALALSNADRATLNAEIEVRRDAEAALRKAQDALSRNSRLAALGQLAASITHELGQPISAMRNYLTAEEITAGAPPGGLNAQLSGLVDRMQRITGQLRFFATPAEVEATPFDLNAAIAAAADLVRHQAVAKDVAMTIPTAPSTTIAGNQHRLEQVLVNLLRNAVEAATGDIPRVWMDITAGYNHITLAINDTGPGLGTATLDQLQEPFHTTKSSGEGMGLGLAISTQIIEEFGGKLHASSNATGATFSLTLPTETPNGED